MASTFRSPQVAEQVEVLRSRDMMNVATDELLENLSNIMMQLEFARNRMAESLDPGRLERAGELYNELAIQVTGLADTTLRMALVVQVTS